MSEVLVTPWTAAYQAPPSMGFSRQVYWSGVPLPSPNLKNSLKEMGKPRTGERESHWNSRAKHKWFTDLLFEVLVWGVSFSCQKMEKSLQGSYQSFLFSTSWEMTKKMVTVWHRIFSISHLCKFSLKNPMSLTFPPDSLKIVLHALLKLGTLSQTSVLQAMFKLCQIWE